MDYSIRPAKASDLPSLEALLPRLADFDVPNERNPTELWHGDRDLIREWAEGTRADVEVIVAVREERVMGMAALSVRIELLSGGPSAHVEILSLSNEAEGFGVGAALMQAMESIALDRGANSMSLHVFANNTRARALYEKQGYDGELMRYFKRLGQ